MKSCGASAGMTSEQLVIASRLQQKHSHERAALGLSPFRGPPKPSKLTATSNQHHSKNSVSLSFSYIPKNIIKKDYYQYKVQILIMQSKKELIKTKVKVNLVTFYICIFS